MLEQIKSCIEKIQKLKPLVLNLTNYVTMDFVANTFLDALYSPDFDFMRGKL